MPSPVSIAATTATFNDAYQDWLDAFPASVPETVSVNQDGVEVGSDNRAYQCGQDAEIDKHVCQGGVRRDGAGIVEIHDHSSPAEVSRRTEQSHGFTRESFTRWWIIDRYTSKGQPAPVITPSLQRVIDRDFLQQQQADSVKANAAWERYGHAAGAGNMIASGTLTAIASMPVLGLVIDNPAMLVKMLAAAKTAPMLTSSGGPDGGMGTVIEVAAVGAVSPGSRAAAKAATPAATQTVRLSAQEAAVLEARVVGAAPRTARTVDVQPRAANALGQGTAGASPRLLDAGPALTPPQAPPKLLGEAAPRSYGRQLRDAYKDHGSQIDYEHIEGHVQTNGAGVRTVKGGHFPTTERLTLTKDDLFQVAHNRVMSGRVTVDGLAKTNNHGISTVAPNYLTHAQSEAEMASALAARQQVGNQWFGTSLDGTTWRLFPPTPNIPQWRGYPLFEELQTVTHLTPLPASSQTSSAPSGQSVVKPSQP